ncbi:hypothetical protein HDU93_009377, partial [Gonapodya sp. JEL0774]
MSQDLQAAYEARLKPTDPATGRRRAILITGAASGMGLETARLFSRAGWFVVAIDVNQDSTHDPTTGRTRPGLSSLSTELGGPSNVHTALLSVSDKPAFDSLVDQLETILPAVTNHHEAVLDVVFANAGIGRGGMWSDQPWQQHLDVVNVNFVGVMVTIYCSLRLVK